MCANSSGKRRKEEASQHRAAPQEPGQPPSQWHPSMGRDPFAGFRTRGISETARQHPQPVLAPPRPFLLVQSYRDMPNRA